MPPLWRVVVGPNGACYYGPEDDRYGTEAEVRRDYEARIRLGDEVRLEHRETPQAKWRTIEKTKAVDLQQKRLF
jgi:hypothetical protein